MFGRSRIVLFAALLGALAGAARAADEQSAPPMDPDLGARIESAFAADGKLWLTGAAPTHRRNRNALISLSLANGERTLHFRDGVVAMTKADGHLWILHQAKAHEDTYWLLEWKDGAFASVRSFEGAGEDTPIALAVVGGKPAVISFKTVRVLEGDGWRKTKVSVTVDASSLWGVVTSGAPAAGDQVYLGLDRGEWGGGMLRFDLTGGGLKKVESEASSAGGFGTVLDADLDPVNGIVADPGNPNCIIAAVGLIHFMSSGRVLRVCGDKVEVVFENLIPQEVNGNKFNESEAFFGLVPAKGGYWAVSDSCVYRFHASGMPDRFDFPKLESWHGFELSRAIPGTIVLSTDMNWQFSVSGYTPLIVALED